MSAKKGSPGPEWKHAWNDAKTGDDLYLHEGDGTVFFDPAERGHDHQDGIFCRLCLPRLNAIGAAAEKCLDPKASAFVEEIAGDNDAPEYLALQTLGSRLGGSGEKRAFAMRNDGGLKIVSTKLILTTKKNNKPFDHPIILADYQTKSNVCDAFFMSAFSVRLKDGIPEHYVRRLWETKLTFKIDEDSLVKDVPLKEILQRKEIVFPKPIPDKSFLFHAIGVLDPLGNAKGDDSEWHGYMLPNGTQICATLEGVEGGGGLIFIETIFKLARYTTKEMKKNG